MSYITSQSPQFELDQMNPQAYTKAYHQSVSGYYPGQPSTQQHYVQNGAAVVAAPAVQSPAKDTNGTQELAYAEARNDASKNEQQAQANGEPQNPNNKSEDKKKQPGEVRLVGDYVGQFDGGSYRIAHRDANSNLIVELFPGFEIYAKPGAMIAMCPSMSLIGTVSFSWMKIFTRGDFAKSIYTGGVPIQNSEVGNAYTSNNNKRSNFSKVELAPSILGDINAIDVDSAAGSEGFQEGWKSGEWKVSRDAFLAATSGVMNDYKTQGIAKAMFSGEGLFVYTFSGKGVLWVQGFGAIIRKDIKKNEKWIVDNNHLIAWNCPYTIKRVASGGIISGVSSREGLVCEFIGKGSIYYHTRKLPEFAAYLKKAGR